MSDTRTPTERSLAASIAAHSKWAQQDPREGTAAARKTFLDSFAQRVDPDGVLDPKERQRRSESLRRAHFKRLALASAKARRKARAS